MKRKKKCKYISKKKTKQLSCNDCYYHKTHNELGDGSCNINPSPIYRKPDTPICISHFKSKQGDSK